MKTVLQKSLGIFLIDAGFVALVALPPVRQAGVALVLLGGSVAIMTILSVVKNLKEVKSGGQEQGESFAMKALYAVGVVLAVFGFILLLLRRLL